MKKNSFANTQKNKTHHFRARSKPAPRQCWVCSCSIYALRSHLHRRHILAK